LGSSTASCASAAAAAALQTIHGSECGGKKLSRCLHLDLSINYQRLILCFLFFSTDGLLRHATPSNHVFERHRFFFFLLLFLGWPGIAKLQ
jgi:hypothetical protein